MHVFALRLLFFSIMSQRGVSLELYVAEVFSCIQHVVLCVAVRGEGVRLARKSQAVCGGGGGWSRFSIPQTYIIHAYT